MLKEKDEKDEKHDNQTIGQNVADQNSDDKNAAYHKVKMEALVNGSLGQDESMAYLRALSPSDGTNQLTQETFNLTIDAVRATVLPDSGQLFAQAGKLIDCCGTGGSGLSHYNTSTTVAFVLAAAGLKVAKFGNRAASSQSGSFDLLDKLGIGANLPVHTLSDLLQKTNLIFLFAPQFYPALAALAPLRRAVGKPTVFNYIGPLLNPASPVFRLIGVPNRSVQELVIGHLQAEGKVEHALIVNAESGLDELDVHSANTIAKITRKENQEDCNALSVDIERLEKILHLKLNGKREGPLSVGDNIDIFNALISGQLGEHNYYHTLVCLNAAAALRAGGQVDKWEEGAKVATQLLKDGSVKAKFIQYQDQFK